MGIDLALKAEHAELGARFGSFGDAEVVLDYGIPVDEPLPLDHPLALELSFQGSIHVVGNDAARFLQALTSADVEGLGHPGAGVYGLVLTSESEIIDLVRIVRTGDAEFLLVTDAPVTGEVLEWLERFAALEDAEGKLFPGVSIEDQTGRLAVLGLMGAGGADILCELAGEGASRLQSALSTGIYLGHDIGGLPMMIVADHEVESTLSIYASRAVATALWRTLMGFLEVQAVGFDQYVSIRRAHGLWLDGVEEGRYRTPDEAGLTHLLRPGGAYVGAKCQGDGSL